jgi:hypothetical protein
MVPLLGDGSRPGEEYAEQLFLTSSSGDDSADYTEDAGGIASKSSLNSPDCLAQDDQKERGG